MEYRTLFLKAITSVPLPPQKIYVNDIIFKFNTVYIVKEVDTTEDTVLLKSLASKQYETFSYRYKKFPVVISNKLKKEICKYERPNLSSSLNKNYLKSIHYRSKGN